MSEPHANPAFVSQALAIQIRVLIANMHKNNLSGLLIADLEMILADLERRCV